MGALQLIVCWLIQLGEGFNQLGEWLRAWQELIAGLIGAVAIVSTVRWTLLAERRRRAEEAKALRTALGAEFRQFAGRVLDSLTKMIDLLATSPDSPVVGVTTRNIENLTHFPDAVVYPQTASQLGTLGDHAHSIVFFFGQVVLVRDAAKLLPLDVTVISRAQLLNFAQALLNAADAAVEAMPAFASDRWAEGDRNFASQVADARQPLEAQLTRAIAILKAVPPG